MRIYLAGGAVRDRLLGRPVKDRDFGVVGATGEEFMRRFPSAKPVGRLGLTYIYRGEEYTLSRAATMEEDLLTRDLTMNALAEAEDGRIIGPPGALDDLRDKVLRPVACSNFHTDPNRVLRAARFAAAFPDWRVSDELVDCMHEVAGLRLLDDIAAERVGLELRKICETEAPGRFFLLLRDTGALTPWFAQWGEWVNGNPDVLKRFARHLDSAASGSGEGDADAHPKGCEDDRRAVWLVVCAGLEPDRAEAQVRKLKLSLDHIREAVFSSRWLHRLHDYQAIPPEERVDMLLHMDRLQLAVPLARAVRACGGAELHDRLVQDAASVAAVRLPSSLRGLGPESGRRLLQLRVGVLER